MYFIVDSPFRYLEIGSEQCLEDLINRFTGQKHQNRAGQTESEEVVSQIIEVKKGFMKEQTLEKAVEKIDRHSPLTDYRPDRNLFGWAQAKQEKHPSHRPSENHEPLPRGCICSLVRVCTIEQFSGNTDIQQNEAIHRYNRNQDGD